MQTTHSIAPWFVLGTGAIGTLWATKFLKQGIPCALLHKNQPRSPGNGDDCLSKQLGVLDLNAEQSFYSIDSFNILAPGKINKLLLCTKSYQSMAALTQIIPFIAEDAVVVILQNGMGQHQLIAELLPKRQIIIATTTEGALVNSPLCITHTGAGDSFFGLENPLNGSVDKATVECLSSIGMQLQDNIRALLWHKLTINCAINPLTALFNCRNGALLSNRRYYAQLQKICDEVDWVSSHLGFATTEGATLHSATSVAQRTANNFSSMQQDVVHKRKTEIAFINGFLQQQAEKSSLHLPLNSQLIRDIEVLESQY